MATVSAPDSLFLSLRLPNSSSYITSLCACLIMTVTPYRAVLTHVKCVSTACEDIQPCDLTAAFEEKEGDCVVPDSKSNILCWSNTELKPLKDGDGTTYSKVLADLYFSSLIQG